MSCAREILLDDEEGEEVEEEDEEGKGEGVNCYYSLI